MYRVRMAMVSCALFLMAGAVGCGGSNAGDGSTPVGDDRPDAGLEASESIMKMQPPAPPGKKSGRR